MEHSITYRELNEQADKLAALLINQGVRKGDRVGLFVMRSIPMLVGILATLKIGAVYVPQDIRISNASRLKYIMDTASIKVSLTLAAYKQQIPVSEHGVCIAIDEVMTGNVLFDSALLTPPVSSPVQVGKNDPCFILFTSGTTGKPNGVEVTHGNLCNILLTKPGNLGIEPGYKVGQILNIAFDMAAWEIFTCLAHGATLLIRGKDILQTVQDVDVIIATPSILGFDRSG